MVMLMDMYILQRRTYIQMDICIKMDIRSYISRYIHIYIYIDICMPYIYTRSDM